MPLSNAERQTKHRAKVKAAQHELKTNLAQIEATLKEVLT
jgi:hypothetical protein